MVMECFTVMAVVVALPPFLSSSEGMLSTRGDLPAFRLCTASSNSSLSKGRLSSCCMGVWLLWTRLVLASFAVTVASGKNVACDRVGSWTVVSENYIPCPLLQ